LKLSGLDQLTVMRPVNGRFAGNGKDWTLRPIGVTDHATLGPAGSSCNLSGSGYTTALIDRRSTQNEQWAIPATISAMYRECSGGRRNSSCTHACVQMGVNYSATYGTAPTTLLAPLPCSRSRPTVLGPGCIACPAALTPAAADRPPGLCDDGAGVLMNDFGGGVNHCPWRPTLFRFRTRLFHSFIQSVIRPFSYARLESNVAGAVMRKSVQISRGRLLPITDFRASMGPHQPTRRQHLF